MEFVRTMAVLLNARDCFGLFCFHNINSFVCGGFCVDSAFYILSDNFSYSILNILEKECPTFS